MSSKLAVIIQIRDCLFSVENISVLAVVKKTPTKPTTTAKTQNKTNGMLGTIMKGVKNKPENFITPCINPWCVYILNIEYNFGLKSLYILERKEAAEKGNEDDQESKSVSLPRN